MKATNPLLKKSAMRLKALVGANTNVYIPDSYRNIVCKIKGQPTEIQIKVLREYIEQIGAIDHFNRFVNKTCKNASDYISSCNISSFYKWKS